MTTMLFLSCLGLDILDNIWLNTLDNQVNTLPYFIIENLFLELFVLFLMLGLLHLFLLFYLVVALVGIAVKQAKWGLGCSSSIILLNKLKFLFKPICLINDELALAHDELYRTLKLLNPLIVVYLFNQRWARTSSWWTQSYSEAFEPIDSCNPCSQ